MTVTPKDATETYQWGYQETYNKGAVGRSVKYQLLFACDSNLLYSSHDGDGGCTEALYHQKIQAQLNHPKPRAERCSVETNSKRYNFIILTDLLAKKTHHHWWWHHHALSCFSSTKTVPCIQLEGILNSYTYQCILVQNSHASQLSCHMPS